MAEKNNNDGETLKELVAPNMNLQYPQVHTNYGT